MGRFMVGGFIQIETIVKTGNLPVPYVPFQSVPNMIDTSLGGCGYNESAALTWLGDEVDFMSMVGKDMHTDKIYERLISAGINLKMDYVLPRLESLPTAVILYHNGRMQTFEDVKDIREVAYDYELFERQIQDKDMVLISNCNFCRPLIELAKKYNKPLAVNVRSMRKEKIQQKGDFLKAADILYISEDEMDGTPYECLEMCRERFDPKIVIVGMGSKGVILYTKEDNSVLEYKPVKINEVVNTIGAGNSLFSAFLHYYVKTKDAKESIKNALLFAAYKIGFIGTSNGFMTEEQIEQWRQLIWKTK